MNAYRLTLALLAGSSIAMAQSSSIENNVAAEAAPTAEAVIIQAAVITPGLFPTETINFESDTTGSKPNGWQSVDSTNVSFTDSVL